MDNLESYWIWEMQIPFLESSLFWNQGIEYKR